MPKRRAERATDRRLRANRVEEGRSSAEPRVAPSRMQQLINGDLKIEDLDDDEIRMGRCKDKNGKFSGRPPNMLPRAILDAFRKEFDKRANEVFNEGLDIAQRTLLEVMQNPFAAAPARVNAANIWIERSLGKVPDKLLATVEAKPYEDIDDLLVDVGVEGDNLIDLKGRAG